MRTYDKQIETIRASQGKQGLRPSFGAVLAAVAGSPGTAAPAQDTARSFPEGKTPTPGP